MPHRHHDRRHRRADPRAPTHVDRLRAAGWTSSSIERAVARGELRRVLPATYVAADVAPDRRTRLAAAREHLGADTTAVLGTAADLHGLPEPWPPDGLVHVALPPGRERVQRPGYRFHTWLIAPREVGVVDGFRVTTVERTLQDLMCLTDRLSAVAAVDAALHQGLVEPATVRRLAEATRRRRGAARSRPWWAEADGRAESPLETRVRLRAVDGGYPPDELQLRFDLHPGAAYVDLAWRLPSGGWLAVEADGATWHDVPDAVYADRRRGNALAARGDVVVVRVVWRDTVSPSYVPHLLARHLGPPAW